MRHEPVLLARLDPASRVIANGLSTRPSTSSMVRLRLRSA